MPLKNQAFTLTYYAWDTVNGVFKTGDAASHALRGSGDGTEYTPGGTPLEINSSDMPGAYKVALAAGEMNYNQVTIGGKSSTAGVVILPVIMFTDRGVLPTVAPNTSNGFVTFGSGTGQLNVSSGVPSGMATAANQASILTAVGNITSQSRDFRVAGPAQMEIPASGTVAYEFDITVRDPATGGLIAADSTPTVIARNAAGSSLNANLSAVGPGTGTGRYKFTYTVGSSDAAWQEVIIEAAGTVSGNATGDAFVSTEAPAFPLAFTSSDRTALNSVVTTLGAAGAGLTGLPAVTVGTNNDKTGYILSAAGLDAVKGWGTWSARQTIQAIAQFLFGKRSGVPAEGVGGTATYQDNASVSYGSVTVDTAGNITASAMTPPA